MSEKSNQRSVKQIVPIIGNEFVGSISRSSKYASRVKEDLTGQKVIGHFTDLRIFHDTYILFGGGVVIELISGWNPFTYGVTNITHMKRELKRWELERERGLFPEELDYINGQPDPDQLKKWRLDEEFKEREQRKHHLTSWHDRYSKYKENDYKKIVEFYDHR